MSKLLPCPHCKFKFGEDLLDVLYPTTRWAETQEGIVVAWNPHCDLEVKGYVWKVVCNESMGGCSASIEGYSEEEVTAKWNRRD